MVWIVIRNACTLNVYFIQLTIIIEKLLSIEIQYSNKDFLHTKYLKFVWFKSNN